MLSDGRLTLSVNMTKWSKAMLPEDKSVAQFSGSADMMREYARIRSAFFRQRPRYPPPPIVQVAPVIEEPKECAMPPPRTDLPRVGTPAFVKYIQAVVARRHGLGVGDLIGTSRRHLVMEPRHIAVYVSKNMTDLSLPRIGQLFGGRDHTTIIHACRRVERFPGLLAEAKGIIAELTKNIPSERCGVCGALRVPGIA